MLLSRAAAAVSERLLQEVINSFKRLLKLYYESQEQLAQAPEWQEIIKSVCIAGETYVDIAMAHRTKIRGDLLQWIKTQIEEDDNSISRLHFGWDRGGYFAGNVGSSRSLNNGQDAWSAMDHIGFRNSNALWSVYRDNMDRAARVALGNAVIRIASGGVSPPQPVKQDISAISDRSQRGAASYPAPLSTFEVRVGELMVGAREKCRTKYLSQDEIFRIAALLDNEKVPVRGNLEREAARTLAEYNQRHPTAAIKNWRTAIGNPQFRRAVRKRFSRAEEKYRKTPPVVVVSAGTSRTTI